MKILYVYGDDDYSALTFCDELKLANDADLLRIWNEAKQNGGETTIKGDGEEYEIFCRACEFGNVDEKFVEWIKYDIELLDYDESKSRDFFVIKDA